ncbi:MAG: head-tail adaptor protein [Lachnospiraceae bacterium]|nr:head-tail adaptor protein [Lachnospiraceae bacterium]
MTFDDGIVKIYELETAHDPGKMPVEGLGSFESFFFGYDTLGITRYYTALQANQMIESVINIPGFNQIDASNHIAVMEDESQFRIVMVQQTQDEFGLRITKLSLERLGDYYAVIS